MRATPTERSTNGPICRSAIMLKPMWIADPWTKHDVSKVS